MHNVTDGLYFENFVPKYSEYGNVLNMARFSICDHCTAFWYATIWLDRVLNKSWVLDMTVFWICKSCTRFYICHRMAEYIWIGCEYAWICPKS